MEPILTDSGTGWAEQLLGIGGWALQPGGGVYDQADGSVSSSGESLPSVVARGPAHHLSCVSYVCVGGPGAAAVDVRIYPESRSSGERYAGWTGSTFAEGPAIEVDGGYWYRLPVHWDDPFPDPTGVFYAKATRAAGAPKPFKIWAFRQVTAGQPGDVMAGEGNLACLYQCARPGPFLRARLTSVTGRGPLRATYGWLYSALNCVPNDDSAFRWDFIKLGNGQLALSPSEPHSGMTLYTSVRPDWESFAQLQAPRSAAWIRGIGADEQLTAEAVGILGAAFKGLNGSYLAVMAEADRHEGHAGYRVRSFASQLVDDCEFVISDAMVLQEGMDFLLSYRLTVEDVRWAAEAYRVPGLTGEDIERMVAAAPAVTPQLLATAQRAARSIPAELGGSVGAAYAGAVVFGLTWAVVGGIMAGPPGFVAGIAIGVAMGIEVGRSLEPHEPHEDPTDTTNPNNPDIARTLIRISPAGGPYENHALWDDLGKFARFPQIGDPALPDAGCLYPAGSGNTVRIWYPARKAVGPSIHDEAKYHPITAIDGSRLTRTIFVIVRLRSDERFQVRLHPDDATNGGTERPNHSQLTQGSRLLSLMGDGSMHVYAAGEFRIDTEGRIRGILSQTGHYFVWSSSFDHEVFDTALAALRALGYDTTNVLLGNEFTRWAFGDR
nr:hypothetical protein [Micromonospora sp. DSM 115978]